MKFWDWQGSSWAVFCSHPADFTPVGLIYVDDASRRKSEQWESGGRSWSLACDPLIFFRGSPAGVHDWYWTRLMAMIVWPLVSHLPHLTSCFPLRAGQSGNAHSRVHQAQHQGLRSFDGQPARKAKARLGCLSPQVCAISCDDAASHIAWIKDIQANEKLSGDFPYVVSFTCCCCCCCCCPPLTTHPSTVAATRSSRTRGADGSREREKEKEKEKKRKNKRKGKKGLIASLFPLFFPLPAAACSPSSWA
jgi:hypothetical protein